jgi:hypothetical protein
VVGLRASAEATLLALTESPSWPGTVMVGLEARDHRGGTESTT